MARKPEDTRLLRSIQWHDADWLWLAEVSKSLGLSRSDFVRRAALAAAKSSANGITPYFLSEAKASPQNTRTSFFRSEGDQKKISGGDLGAGVGRGAIAEQRPPPERNEVK